MAKQLTGSSLIRQRAHRVGGAPFREYVLRLDAPSGVTLPCAA